MSQIWRSLYQGCCLKCLYPVHNTVLPHWHCSHLNPQLWKHVGCFQLHMNLNQMYWGDTVYLQKQKSSQRCHDGQSAAEHWPCSSCASRSLIYVIRGPKRARTRTFCLRHGVWRCPFEWVTQLRLWKENSNINLKMYKWKCANWTLHKLDVQKVSCDQACPCFS